MMAYNNKFVIAVLHNGSPVREIGNTIHLPFHSEYKVRLKNKDPYLRAKACVWIDGKKVSNLGDFILQPNETLDLERFLDESMASGRRFKFVPLSDSRVNDPTDEDNGIIKVEFYRETARTKLKISQPEPPWPTQPAVPFPYWNDDNSSVPYHGGGSRGTCDFTSSYHPLFFSNAIKTSVASNCRLLSPAPTPGQAGATVEGGHSEQSFVYGSDFETEFYPVTLELRIRGIERGQGEAKFGPDSQPRKKKRMIKFCSNCGAKRHRLSDKFCHRCGTAYHPRYEKERGKLVR